VKEEKCLLLAVRNRLRAICGYADQACEVEFDEMAPGTVGTSYVAVQPGGFRAGQHQARSGTVRDYVYAVQVCVIKRVRHVPRDRLRDVFLNNLDALDAEIDAIAAAVDWKYEVTTDANALLVIDGDTAQGFHHPLVFESVDAKPRLVNPEIFAATGATAAGMARTIYFGGARRTKTVNV
jgi:hypothetical protein